MALDLTGVNAKINRAYEHLQTLHEEIEIWAHTDPYGMRQKVSDDGREHSLTLLVHRYPDSPAFGLLVGDCAQNMRSVLDHLVFAVASDVLSEQELADAEEGLAFPICTTQGAWESAIARGRLRGIEGEVLAAIQKRQPYDTPNRGEQAGGPLLSALHWLNNRDKHRVLHALAAFPTMAEIRFTPDLPGPTRAESRTRPTNMAHRSCGFERATLPRTCRWKGRLP